MIRLVFVQWPLMLLLLGLCAVLSYQFDQRHKLWASEALVEFSDPELQRRYYQLIEELRCPNVRIKIWRIPMRLSPPI